MAWIKRFVAINKPPRTCIRVAYSIFYFQLLDLVAKPVKAVILLFPIRGKLEELRQQEEAKLKEEGEEGRVPIDPTVFWIKQTVRFRSCCSANECEYDQIRSATHAERLAFYMP